MILWIEKPNFGIHGLFLCKQQIMEQLQDTIEKLWDHPELVNENLSRDAIPGNHCFLSMRR